MGLDDAEEAAPAQSGLQQGYDALSLWGVRLMADIDASSQALPATRADFSKLGDIESLLRDRSGHKQRVAIFSATRTAACRGTKTATLIFRKPMSGW
jgi:hypothetical protein